MRKYYYVLLLFDILGSCLILQGFVYRPLVQSRYRIDDVGHKLCMEMRPENKLCPGGHKIGKSVHVVHNQGPVWVKVFPMGAKVLASQPVC